MCGTMKIGQPGRKRLTKAQKASYRGGGWASEALSGLIGFSRGFSLKVVASRAFSRFRAVPFAPASVKALRFAPPACSGADAALTDASAAGVFQL